MKSPGEAEPQSRIFITPIAVDFMDTTGRLYQNTVANGEVSPPPSQPIADDLDAILALKQNRDSSRTAVDVSKPDTTTSLRQDRRDALILTDELARKLTSEALGKVVVYGSADVSNLPETTPRVYNGTFKGHPLLVRAEEHLTGSAEQLVNNVEAAFANGTTNPAYSLENGRVKRETREGKVCHIPLRGYTFNRSGSNESVGRRPFPDFPSCEAFIAASVLEQTAQAGKGVIRIVPESAKGEEYAARTLLEIVGHPKLPVLSAVVSEGGNVQKIIPWTDEEADIAHLRTAANAFRAHKTSNRIIKQVHDGAHQRQRIKYDELMLSKGIPDEAKVDKRGNPTNIGDIPPSELMQHDLLSNRILEFLGRTLTLATVYEACKISRENIETVSDDIGVVVEAFSTIGNYRSFQERPTSLHRTVQRFAEGHGSNDVLYTTAQLALRPEVDPSTLRSSTGIQLLAHIVHEHINDCLAAEVANAATKPGALVELLRRTPPRYVLIEAQRIQK